MPIMRSWQRDLIASQTPEQREADARAYREMREKIAEANARKLSPYAEQIERDMAAAGERHEIVRRRVAQSVAKGHETGTVECHCGGTVTYRAPNRFGYRPADCSRRGCMRGAVRA